jgi:hypothetical protein
MTQPNLNGLTRSRVLMGMRIIWATLIFGQLMFLAVIILVILPNAHARQVTPEPILAWVNVAMLATIVPVTFIIRQVMFRQRETQAGIPAGAYGTGNIIFWAGCEGVSMFGLVIAVLNASLWPTIIIVAIALSLQALTFPVGSRLYVPSTEKV